MREPRPITHVEVSEKNKKLRIIAAIIFLIIGAAGITMGIRSATGQDPGWQAVQVYPKERNCSQNFLFRYNFSGSGMEATAVNKKLEAAYEEATVKAYQLFTPDEEIQGVNNIYAINHHPNQELTVDPVLYQAFTKLEGTRWLYLGPAYGHYQNLLYSASDDYVPQLDPVTDSVSAEFVAAVAGFAEDENAVRLELLGQNRLRLHVSQEYLDFAQAEEFDRFIDFSYMANAFIIDYLADSIQALGLTKGYLVSVDGYTRNLDGGDHYSMNLFDRKGDIIYPAGVMHYRGPVSIVLLKNYPTADSKTTYRVSGDHIVHPYVDPLDGIYRTSVPSLVSYSYQQGCADVLLQCLPSFVGTDFSVPEGVHSIWFEDTLLCYNDPAIQISDLLEQEEIRYTAQLRN